MMNFAIFLVLFKWSNTCLTTPDMDLPSVQPTTYTDTTVSTPSMTTTCMTPDCTSSTTTTTTTSSSSTSTTTTCRITTTIPTDPCFANSAPLAQSGMS
ncbi:hypothetical protein WR25_06310 [Diploscapter pachys]|uniref:Integumentary mucin C.1-like n=1 Tax=Diploscapter pachys TaxID=2018661 RepID=A0A2A2L6L6_9BILA|nr:hypothetical protein WR25_06310 [Diploscapter pachys]